MITTIWVLGLVSFLIYDHVIGIGMEDDGFTYWLLAFFWFLSAPILLFKWLKDRKSFVEKSSSDKHR